MMLKFLAFSIATGLGSGYSPIISGTAGSLVAIILWEICRQLLGGISLSVQFLSILVTFVLGIFATHIVIQSQRENPKLPKEKDHTDPGIVVIDEWAGMFITLLVLQTPTLLSLGAAFVLFRIFDILKPWPVRQSEQLPGAIGVMVDDVIAGAYAALVLFLLQYWSFF